MPSPSRARAHAGPLSQCERFMRVTASLRAAHAHSLLAAVAAPLPLKSSRAAISSGPAPAPTSHAAAHAHHVREHRVHGPFSGAPGGMTPSVRRPPRLGPKSLSRFPGAVRSESYGVRLRCGAVAVLLCSGWSTEHHGHVAEQRCSWDRRGNAKQRKGRWLPQRPKPPRPVRRTMGTTRSP